MSIALDCKVAAEMHVDTANYLANNGRNDAASAWAQIAQVHATLALAEQQRITNLLAFVEVMDGPPEAIAKVIQMAGEGLGL